MDFQILYTEPALDDLEVIMAWSWAHHQASTQRFAISLLNHVELLKSFPYMGAPVKRHPGVRRLVHSPLNVFYRVNSHKKQVEILHFWHGARLLPKL